MITRNNKALTLAEIIISTVILSIVMLGLTNLFVSSKRYIALARARMTGGELGRVFIDPLQMYVRQDTWDDAGNALYDGGAGVITYCDSDPSTDENAVCSSMAVSERTFDRREYIANYNITSNDFSGNTDTMRKVRTTINWNEPGQ